MMLISNFQLCLAHFCEVHGPTPLMVTEGLPVKCSSCDDHDAPDIMSAVASAVSSITSSPSSSSTPHAAATAATVAVAGALRKMSLGQPSLRSLPDSEDRPSSPADIPTASASRRSPRSSASPKDVQKQAQTQPIPSQKSRVDPATSNFRKTYDESVTKRAIPCDNCAMTLPGGINSGSNTGTRNPNGGGSTSAPGSSNTDTRNPTLRTRVPCARVYDGAPGDASPRLLHPSSSSASSSTSSDAEGDERQSSQLHRNHHRRTGTMTSVGTSRSSTSSSASHLMSSHTHYMNYTSTHEPVSAKAFGNIRASCLRTLTLETLPRSPASSAMAASGGMFATTSQPTTPLPLGATSYFTSNPHSAASASATAAAAANGGPLFFGDSETGYTTAHVFRVADVHARGHKRMYALIALNTHRERTAMKAFGFVSAAFNDLATWIQHLADAEAERVAPHNESPATSSPSGDSSPLANTNPAFGFDRSPHVSPPPTQPSSVANDSGSSFLVAAGNGLSRRMGPGFAGYGGLGSSTAASVRARGLPEILGMPDFFIELHARFVRLLLELGVALNQ
ncbi:hypothetical protein SPBR_07031 [Sporothrix brasiliensis 5110]|uniref:UDENN FLCN/SMCR8-type domain-containing protein n=1 Tax=Sporothrix brasiliensis 5110 TaxID=1398154 RepID=A0A0C2FD06_9PEZI|nr:uncharacterized protein SPBR_07031 [Sporothrix brasiliensis 5110]KIH89028.1 hypothetical protein SPBR_07031 [Sporothrix brasiliensis 5110]